MEVRQRLPVRMAEMMMVNRIVTYRDSCPVVRVFIVERCRRSVNGEESLSIYASRLPMIRYHRQSILSREDIVSYSEMLHAELRLYEIYIAQCSVPCSLQSLSPVSRFHIYDIYIIIVSIDRPVQHIISTRQRTIFQHLVSRPYDLSCISLSLIPVERIDAAVSIYRRIVSFRTGNRHISACPVILKNCYDRKVLNHIIFLRRSDRFAGIGRRVHTHAISDAAHRSHIAKLGSIYQHVGHDLTSATVAVRKRNYPVISLSRDSLQFHVPLDRQPFRIRPSHCSEYLLAHLRLEADIADPACLQGVISSIMGSERIEEFAEHAASEIVISVDAAYARRSQHSAKPWTFLEQHHINPHPCRLDSSSDTAGATSHNKYINTFHLRA